MQASGQAFYGVGGVRGRACVLFLLFFLFLLLGLFFFSIPFSFARSFPLSFSFSLFSLFLEEEEKKSQQVSWQTQGIVRMWIVVEVNVAVTLGLAC